MITRKTTFIFFIITFLALQALQASQVTEALHPRHKEWLGMVSPIISKGEREVFFKLKTTEEREKFIRLFWKRRDPLPDTEENEFYQEYMKRVRFADLHFGYGTSRKGHETERGYFYLLLGPPLERQVFATHSYIWPLELWYYRGEQEYGLPPYFYLIFFQPEGMGEYRLYSPEVDGPQRLVVPSLVSGPVNNLTAFRALREISGELGAASLSYLPGDSSLGMTSLSSGSIISGVYGLAEKKFSDAYARSFLAFNEYVEVDYSHNYIESNGRVHVFTQAGQPFLHWTLEPSQINFADYKGRRYASYQLVLKVEDSEGRTILEKEEEVPLSITPEDYARHERRIFAFQDVLPVIPGEFILNIFLKNKTARDFTSYQTRISIPEPSKKLSLGDPIFYLSRESLPENQRTGVKPFALGGTQYMVNAQNHFLPGRDIGLYCQVFPVQDVGSASIRVEVVSQRAGASVHTIEKPLAEALTQDGTGVDLPSIVPGSLNPGYYQAVITLLNGQGESIMSRKENFILLTQAFPVVPWVFAKLHPPFPSPEALSLLATQYFMVGRYDKAREHLERSLSLRDVPATRSFLARTLYAQGNFQDSLKEAIPLFEATGDSELAKIIALDYHALGDWQSALDYLEMLMTRATEISVLNLAAECYLNLNQPQRALPLLEKSLELNPDQPKIRELEKKARKSAGSSAKTG